MSRSRVFCLSILLLVLCQAPALAQTSAPKDRQGSDRGTPARGADEDRWESESRREDALFSLRGGIGFTADPGTFLMTVEMPWHIDELVSIGPMFQLGVSDDEVYFAPTLGLYLHPRLTGDLEPFHPYGHVGFGLAYLDKDDRGPRDGEDADFQFTAGLGVEYELRKDFLMGTGLLFNVIPDGVVGEEFIFGWQVLTFRHSF